MPHALIVDDARMMRRLLSASLGDLGFEVAQASNGMEALQALRQNPTIQVVLVDWNMPVMNGLEFLKAARAIPEFSSLPIVMVTSETEVDQIVAALDAGATDYIMKPFTPEVVAEKLLLLDLVKGQNV